MGKKGTKRRTRWKALPLSNEDGASGNEDELQDDERSTTSSGRIVVRMGEKPYRHMRRYPFERDRSREPLIKLESKTFDEEEYTKITTPRQDVLFKKGYFAKRKLESSIEESLHASGEIAETENEDSPMEQIIITNGFVDERGHYLVNGTSYEIYDPYTNTVTVMVGPPPYTSGVTPPVLAAVSCQPVPLQPVDWYPTGPGDWPPGPAWTPAYPPPKGPDTASSEGESSGSTGSEEATHFQPPFLFPGLVYPVPFRPNGVPENENPPEPSSEVASDETPPCQTPTMENGFNSNANTSCEVVSPSSLNPSGPEFIPNSATKPHVPSQPLKPNGAVFVPRTHSSNSSPAQLKPTGAEFVPRQTITPTPEPRLQQSAVKPQTADATSTPPPESSLPPPLPSPLELRTDEASTISDKKSPMSNNREQLASEVIDKVSTTAQIEKGVLSSETMSIPPVVVQNAAEQAAQTLVHLPKESHATQTIPEDGEIPAKRTEPPTQRHPVRRSPFKTQSTVNNKPSPVIEPSRPRRSYAKTVINGLDQVTGMTNGHDSISESKVMTNGKEGKEKDVIINGKPTYNGVNGTHRKQLREGRVSPRVRETVNGKDHGGRERFVNGQNSSSEKIQKTNKETNDSGIMNGTLNGREKRDVLINGNGKSPRSEKPRMANGVGQAEDINDMFIPVESRRSSKAVHNGFSRGEVKNNKYNTKQHTCDLAYNNKDVTNTKKEVTDIVSESLVYSQFETVNKTANASKIMDQPTIEAVPDKLFIESDKSSTVSELSSPLELSSGQTTPPDKTQMNKLEEKSSCDLSKSVEKLKENLEVEVEERKTKKAPKKGKKKQRVELPKEKEEEIFEEPPPLPAFLQPPPDELAHLDKLLGSATGDAILKSLRVPEPAFSKVNLFTPRPRCFPCDLYTKTNLSNMRTTRPEELFASIVEHPTIESPKASEKIRKLEKSVSRVQDRPEAVRETQLPVRKAINTAYKPSKKKDVKQEEPEITVLIEETTKIVEEKSLEPNLGIVDAVKTWLESQDTELEDDIEPEPKNGVCNPLHVSSVEPDESGGCTRVADDTENSVQNIEIQSSVVADGLSTTSSGVASLVDARASVEKYYNLTPKRSTRQSEGSETSEQEAIDALEYTFPQPANATNSDQFPSKELACKLQ